VWACTPPPTFTTAPPPQIRQQRTVILTAAYHATLNTSPASCRTTRTTDQCMDQPTTAQRVHHSVNIAR
jgi:hypothetical protein